MTMKSFSMAAFIVAASCLSCVPAAAQSTGQSTKVQPGTFQDKKVQAGYGLDKDQPFAGADPDGTGLPFKEPPPAAVAAAKKAPTPRLPDGHPDLTGFWAPAGWGYAVTQGADQVRTTGGAYYTQRAEDGPNQTPEKAADLK